MVRRENAGDEASLALTDEQVDRYADLIAAGEAELPDGLSRQQEEELIARTRARLRRRLIVLIARQIAADLGCADRDR